MMALHRKGYEFPVEIAISPARLGDAYIFSAFVRDITARRRAERRLTSQYEVTRVLAESRTLEEAGPENPAGDLRKPRMGDGRVLAT